MDDMYNEDEYDIITQMANTIDALNTNIILLNRFIMSAYNLYNTNDTFKENVEITTYDESGNIIACVKSDGSGNFIPCTHMDASGNLIPCVLPPMPAGLSGPHVHINSVKKTRNFGYYPQYPYYNPYYSPYYGPYYDPYRYPYYNVLFGYDDYDRGIHRHPPNPPNGYPPNPPNGYHPPPPNGYHPPPPNGYHPPPPNGYPPNPPNGYPPNPHYPPTKPYPIPPKPK